MRVGIDISPLALTRAGTARYLQELLPRLHRRVDLVQLAFGGPGRVRAAVRDAAWYPLGLPRRALLTTWMERMNGRFEAAQKV